MQELPKLQEMLKAALAQTAQECGTLLGQQFDIRVSDGSLVTRDDYFNGKENASFVVGIESQEEYQGGFCLVLTFKDAIVLSGTLLGIPAPRILEKKKMAIVEADDMDAFTEIANQVIGSFNAVFKRTLPRKAHLKQVPTKQFIPKQDTVGAEEPIADGEYYMVPAQLTLAGTELEQLDILIPLPLAKMLDLRERAKEELQTSNIETPPPVAGRLPEAENAAVSETGVLILNNDARERQLLQDILSASGVSPVGAGLDSNLKKLLSRKGLKVVLLNATNANDQELEVCLYIKDHLKGAPVPIIMCAHEWTRFAVLKALKNGAGDIMLTPSSPDELASKVLQRVNRA